MGLCESDLAWSTYCKFQAIQGYTVKPSQELEKGKEKSPEHIWHHYSHIFSSQLDTSAVHCAEDAYMLQLSVYLAVRSVNRDILCYFKLPGLCFPRSLTSPPKLSRATLSTHFPTIQLFWIWNNFLKLLRHTFKHASFTSVKICTREIKRGMVFWVHKSDRGNNQPSIRKMGIYVGKDIALHERPSIQQQK